MLVKANVINACSRTRLRGCQRRRGTLSAGACSAVRLIPTDVLCLQLLPQLLIMYPQASQGLSAQRLGALLRCGA